MNVDDIPADMCIKWGVVLKRKRIHVALAPKEQENVEENIINKFEGHRKMFHADLGGVLLSFDKVEVRRKDLRELPRWPLLYLPIEADFVLFHPRRGLELGCMVLRKEDKFIECLFMGLFSVNVSKPGEEKGWEGERVEIGMPVKVEIISVAYTLYNVPVMEGRLVQTMEKEIKVDLVEEFQGVEAEDDSEVKLCGRKIKREREEDEDEDEDERKERKRRKREKKRKLNSGEGWEGINFSNPTETLENISVDTNVASIEKEILGQEELKKQRKKEKKQKKESKNKHLEEKSESNKLPMEESKCEGKDDVLNHEVADLAKVERQLEVCNENNPVMPSSEMDIMFTDKLVDNGRKHKKRKKQKDKESKRHHIYLGTEESSEMDCSQQRDSSKNMLSISGNDATTAASGLQQFEKELKKRKKEKKRNIQEARIQQEVIEESREAGDVVDEELSDSGSEMSRTTTIDGYTFVEHSQDRTTTIDGCTFVEHSKEINANAKDYATEQMRPILREEIDANHSRKELKSIEMTLPYTSSFESNSASEEEEVNEENDNNSKHQTLKERINLKSTSSCINKEDKNSKKSGESEDISGISRDVEIEMPKEDTKRVANLKSKPRYDINDVNRKPNDGELNLKNSENASNSFSEEEEKSKLQDKKEKSNLKLEQSPKKLVSTFGNSNEKKETSKDKDTGKATQKPEVEHDDLTPLNSKTPLSIKHKGKPSLSNNFHLPTIWSVTSRGLGKSLKYTYHAPDGEKFSNFKKAHEHEAILKLLRVAETTRPTRTSEETTRPETTGPTRTSSQETTRPARSSSESNASDKSASEFVDSTSSVNMQAAVPKVSESKIFEAKSTENLSHKTSSKSKVSENSTPEPRESEKEVSEAEILKKTGSVEKVSENVISKSNASNIDTSEPKLSDKVIPKSKGSKKIRSDPKMPEKASSELNASKTANNSSKNSPLTESQNNASVRDHEIEVESLQKEKKSPQFSSTVLPTPNFSTSTSVKTSFEKLLFGYDKMEGNSAQLDGISPILKPGSKHFEKLSKAPEPNLEESVLKSLVKPKKLKKNKKRKSEPGFL